MSPRTPEGGQATNRVTWLKRNILLSQTPLSWGTYPAVAGYLQRGSVVTVRGRSTTSGEIRK